MHRVDIIHVHFVDSGKVKAYFGGKTRATWMKG